MKIEDLWIDINNQPIPLDTPVLVYLTEPSLGRHVHSAEFNAKGFSIIGHNFAWDVSKPTHWMLEPKEPKNRY